VQTAISPLVEGKGAVAGSGTDVITDCSIFADSADYRRVRMSDEVPAQCNNENAE